MFAFLYKQKSPNYFQAFQAWNNFPKTARKLLTRWSTWDLKHCYRSCSISRSHLRWNITYCIKIIKNSDPVEWHQLQREPLVCYEYLFCTLQFWPKVMQCPEEEEGKVSKQHAISKSIIFSVQTKLHWYKKASVKYV